MVERVLVLSYAFPPLAAPESILVAKAVRALTEQGVEVDVIAATTRPWQRRDTSLVDYVAEVPSVHRVVQPLWLPLVQPVRSVRRFPDAMRLLSRRADRVIRRLDLRSYDAVLSWSQWHSVHLVALELKRRHPELRWVAHFSDPWVGNPLVPLGRWSAPMAERMERHVIEAADVVEFTTDEAAALTLGRYPADWRAKGAVIPHAFDTRLFGTPSPPSAGLVARYVGSFYGARSPAPLFEGLLRLAQRRSEDVAQLRVELIGDVPDAHLEGAARGLPRELVHHRSPVPYLASLSAMASADLLLLVDAPAERNVYLASKLIDYVGAGRPIVAITPPGRAAEIVTAIGGAVADPTDADAIAEALAAGLAMARACPPGSAWGEEAVRRQFSLGEVARARLKLLAG